VAASSNRYSQSQLRGYGWRAFGINFLCGIVAIAWYAVFLVERVTLAALTRLEGLAHSPADCPDSEHAEDALNQVRFPSPQDPTHGLKPPPVTSVQLGQMQRSVCRDRTAGVTARTLCASGTGRVRVTVIRSSGCLWVRTWH
jgi:hypothetical protein